MVDGFRVPLLRVGPGLQHLKNEQIVFVHQAAIDHLAFEIGKTLGDQGRPHPLGLQRRQADLFEFRYIAA